MIIFVQYLYSIIWIFNVGPEFLHNGFFPLTVKNLFIIYLQDQLEHLLLSVEVLLHEVVHCINIYIIFF